jgi:hypothetical protein
MLSPETESSAIGGSPMFKRSGQKAAGLSYQFRASFASLANMVSVILAIVAVQCQSQQSAVNQYACHDVTQFVQDRTQPLLLAFRHDRLRSANIRLHSTDHSLLDAQNPRQ